jgi:hypothetical protein
MTDETFEIETGVPIPPRGRQASKECATFRALDVGQSFFISPRIATKVEQRLRMCASRERKGITIRHVGNGTRIWRIEK